MCAAAGEQGDKFPASFLLLRMIPSALHSSIMPCHSYCAAIAIRSESCAEIEPNFDRGWKIAAGLKSPPSLSLSLSLSLSVFEVSKFS